MSDKKVETIKTYCYNCGCETNQDILFDEFTTDTRQVVWRNLEDFETKSTWHVVGNIWTLSKCKGCDKKNFKHIVRSSPDTREDIVFHFPKKVIRKMPDWVINLPLEYCEIFQEIYDSVNEGLFVLSLTGIRILLDIYMVKKVGDIGNFQQKIVALVSQGYITETKADVLRTTIEAGNASAHRGYKPDKETLFQIIDILDNLLFAEIVDRNAPKIKQKIPARKKN